VIGTSLGHFQITARLLDRDGEGPLTLAAWVEVPSPKKPQALLPRYSMIDSVRMSARVSKWASPSSALAAVGSPK
jgi:hypothetical protein